MGRPSEFLAKAFNWGSDARLAGQHFDCNPYVPRSPEWKYWLHGWKDVNLFWGRNSLQPVAPLPELSPQCP